MQGGLEISVKLMAEIDASEKNEAIMKRLKELITDNYKEPDIDGKFWMLYWGSGAATYSARWVKWWGERACDELKFEPSYLYVNS